LNGFEPEKRKSMLFCSDAERERRIKQEDRFFDLFIKKLHEAKDEGRIFIGDFGASILARELAGLADRNMEAMKGNG
jgi:hypothetical protein